MTTLCPSPQPAPPPDNFIRLLNSIVDVCLVYGFDETCVGDLEIEEDDREDLGISMERILQRDIKLRFLQVLAPGRVYPERCTLSGENCSPDHIDTPTASQSPEDSLSAITPSPTHSNKQFNVEEFGLSWDTIENKHYFIFPDHVQIYSDDLEPSVVPMLFTNLYGDHSYAVGLRFSRPFFIEKKKNSRYYCLTPWSATVVPSLNSKLVYLPTCCVLVSKKPYFKFMKDALSGFSRTLTDCEETDFWDEVRIFSERIFLVPSPPPGLLSVGVHLPGFTSKVTIRPPRGEEYLDIRLNYPFLSLSEDNVLKVFCAFLTEQRILFTSAMYPLLTYTIQCFLSYITPFHWRFAVAPILPYQLLEILDAPLTTIMGVHSSLLNEPEFERVDNVVIVDLDNGTVTCKDLETNLPALPHHAVETFKLRYSQLMRKSYVLEEVKSLSVESSEHAQKERDEFDKSCDEMLSKMFLELMVNLYSHVTQELLQSRVKYEEAVRVMPAEDRNFYRQIESTDMFTAFCQSKRQGTHRDEFTLLAERLKKMERSNRNPTDESLFTTSIQLPRSSLSNIFSPQMSSPSSTVQIPLTTMTRHSGSNAAGIAPQGRYITAPASYRSHGNSFAGGVSPSPSWNSTSSDDSSVRTSPLGASLSVSPLEPVHLELPSLGSGFTNRSAFLKETITLLDELRENNAVKAQCVYLRAFYRLCSREITAAMDDLFDTLQRLEVSLVPDKKRLQCVIKHLSAVEHDELMSKTYYKHLVPTRRKAPSVSSSPGRHAVSPSSFNLDKKMPRKPLSLNDFLKLVRQNAIAADAETASNLHRVLSQGRNTTISPETFRVFYEAWKVVHQENSNVDLLLLELERCEAGVQIGESILAVTSDIRTNYGTTSTLVLTTYRLLVVSTFKTYVMADLRTPIRFENFSYQINSLFLGTKAPGIRLERLDKGKHGTASSTSRDTNSKRKQTKQTMDVFMAFQDHVERENWYHMIREVQVGWQIAQARKDPCIMETANSHVILLNTINQSGLLDKHNHCQRVKVSLKLLSFQSKDVSEVSKFTVEALQYRINPCLHETERQTVESLLYIPPTDPYEDEPGKIWIGLGNGRLKVYDIETRCFESDIKITESRHGKSVRLSCLLLVGQHVWVGSFSRNIHILDAQTMCHVSQLSYLEDAPRDLILSPKGNLVWGLLLNGVLLAWDPNTRKRVQKIQVPIAGGSHAYTTCTCFTIWRDNIWVGTNRGSISVMDSQSGDKLTELFFPGGSRRQIEIKHLALSSEDEVWCSVYSIPRSDDSTFIAVFDPDTMEKKLQYSKLDNRVSIILPVNNTMWCGTKSGKIYIFHAKTYAERKGMPKILSAHDDFIRTMTMTDINLVVSGSGSNDGYAAVWKTIDLPQQ